MKILICNLGIGGGGAERVLVDFITYWANATESAAGVNSADTKGTKMTANTAITAGGGGINPKSDIDLFLIEQKEKDYYLPFCREHLRKVFSFPHIFGKVRFLNKFFKRRVLNNPSLINYFIKERYDVNIGFLEGISTIYISQKNGGVKIGYIHTALKNMRDNKPDKQELEAYMRCDRLICVSHYAKTSLLELYPQLDAKRVEVIYNPINKEQILYKANIESIPKHTFSFLQVGRLTYQKGLITLLEANKILQDKGLVYEIWLVGEGARYKKELDSIIAAQGVQNVRFFGFCANPYPYIKACDVMLLSSYFEGYGLVLAESCVLEKAIISSDIPSSREVLTHETLGECGAFFTSKNAQSLAQQMEELYCNATRREELAHKAKVRAQDFDIAKSAKQFESLLTHLVK